MAVQSEVGRLQEVILHRPGRELERLTPGNKDDYLFDEVVWVERAQHEHDGFAATLRALDVKVHLLTDLLSETLAVPEARKHVLDRALDERVHGPLALDSLYNLLAGMDAPTAAQHLVAGMSKRELLEHVEEPPSLVVRGMGMDDMLVAPLPNHLFTRDPSAWIYGGVSVNAMRRRARMRETLHYEAIYRWHPRFSDAVPRWTDGAVDAPASLEGGDILVLGGGALLVGMSERTTPQGIERMALRLFARGAAERIVALALPRQRAFMHLDTVMTMADERTFVTFAGLGDRPAYTIEPGDNDKELAITVHPPERMRTRSPRRSAGTTFASLRRRTTTTRLRGSSGTTAATCSPCVLGSSSPTSATSRRTRCWSGMGSRSWPSRQRARPRPRRTPVHELSGRAGRGS